MNQDVKPIAGKARRAAEVVANFIIVLYAAVIGHYLMFGPVDTLLSDHLALAPDIRIKIGDAAKPLMILTLVVAMRISLGFFAQKGRTDEGGQDLAGYARFAQNELGPPILTLSVFLSCYILYTGAILPMWQSLVTMTEYKTHQRILKQAVAAIPNDEMVFATSGSYFEALVGRPNTNILAGVDQALAKASDGNVFFVVDTYLGKSRKEKEALELMNNPAYHLTFFSHGIYIFAPGGKVDLDYDVYSGDFLSLHADKAEHQVGALTPDKLAKNKLALVAKKEKDKPGFLVYGKYMTLKQGHHEAVFRLKIDRKTPDVVAEMDVASDHGKTILTKINLRGADFKSENQWEEFKIPFEVGIGGVDTAQLRVFYIGGADLYFSRLVTLPDKKTFGE